MQGIEVINVLGHYTFDTLIVRSGNLCIGCFIIFSNRNLKISYSRVNWDNTLLKKKKSEKWNINDKIYRVLSSKN